MHVRDALYAGQSGGRLPDGVAAPPARCDGGFYAFMGRRTIGPLSPSVPRRPVMLFHGPRSSHASANRSTISSTNVDR
jgi:hypothetical protein